MGFEVGVGWGYGLGDEVLGLLRLGLRGVDVELYGILLVLDG